MLSGGGDIRVDLLFEEIERQRAVPEHDVVEFPDVEARAQRLLGLAAQFFDLQLAELVRERLSRPGDIAIDLR